MQIIDIEIGRVKPYENNPRDNKQAVDKVAESIKAFGWEQPIVVDKNYVIIAGHTRYEAAKKLGLDSVPVFVASHLSDAQVKAYRLADNKVAEFSYWDYDKLEQEFKDLNVPDIDFSALGFDYDFSLELEDNDNDDVTTDVDGNSGDYGNDDYYDNGNEDSNGDTDEFDKIDENLKTEHKCPMCGYEW